MTPSLKRLMLAACVVVPAFVAGSVPRTFAEPPREPAPSGHQSDARPGFEGIRPGGGRFRMSPEEQREALAFIEPHMPVLHQLISEAPKNSPRHFRLVRFAVDRYRWMRRIEREEHPEFYEYMLNRLRSQDEMFDLAKQYEVGADDVRVEVREQLRVKTREMVQQWIEERQRRLDNLRKHIDEESERLADDQENLEELTEQRLERFLENLDDPSRDEPRRPDGFRRDEMRRRGEEPATQPTTQPSDDR